MPRHRNLNLQKFLDSVPGSLLREYFEKYRTEPGALPADYSTDAVNEFLDGLDEDLKRPILEDFTHINDVAEKQMNYLVRATQQFAILTSGEEKTQELAMHLFLHHREAFDYAYDYYCLYNASSRMSRHQLPTEDFVITEDKITRFREAVRRFYSEQAKGQECIIRHYDEDDKAVIVIIHGTYKRSVMIWEDTNVKTVFFRPAYEDILVYEKGASTLSIKASYPKDKENYIKAFTEVILSDGSQAEHPNRDATYTLRPLQDGTFCYSGNNEIKLIILREVKLALRGLTNPTVEIKSDNILNTLDEDLDGIKLNSGELVHARFCFLLKVGKGKPKKVTFEITPPNVTDLTKKKYADIISSYLKENGIQLV
ncbi:MAG: hypothetical protein C4519_17175 [Desulfobacteraceae bacterium]|nr:MAG: hypothetical protein C4519_17175 [Desulfobacteraceae bacterium]